MTPKQKILSIRLAELITKNHTFAKSIGLKVKNKEYTKVKGERNVKANGKSYSRNSKSE